MRILTITVLLLATVSMARADLFVVVGKDGVRSIVSKRKPGSKTLWKEKARRRTSSAQTSSGKRGKGRGPEPLSARRRAKRYESIVKEAAAYHSLPEALIWAVMRVESHFQPHVVSHKGAQGLMQLMPATAQSLGVNDAFDPDQNVDGGVRYLSELLTRYGGDRRMALAAYNAGPGRVAQYGGVPPFVETRQYIDKVLRLQRLYRRR